MSKTNFNAVILFLAITALTFISQKAYGAEPDDETKPLLTIACLSDLHCEYGLLNCKDVNDVQLRRTTTETLRKIRETEDIDILLLGGDYTSLVTTTQAN